MTDENEVATPSPVLKVSEWRDFREGDEFPDSTANLKEESAQTCVNGRHVRFVGREIHEFSILCRKVCHETMEI
ncbi:hypothetical protein M3Y99_01657600 [Aphelenchoides fujianensis]|nr:hypothetical protein M3Y99_01657600 [Aphelenchoides fujianensis]